LIEDQLGAWGIAIVAGDTAKGTSLLNFARTLTEPLRMATGDPFMVDAVAAIDRANAQSDRARFRALAEGHTALAAGLQAFRKFKYREASVTLASARKLLALGASPMSGWASLFEARSHIVEPKNSTLATLTALRRSTPGRYLVLRSSAAQYVGFSYDIRSDYVHSIAAYDSALLESRTTGESQTTLRVGSWLSQEAGVIGGREAGWRALYSALAAVPRYAANDRSVYTVFDYAALATGSHAPRLSLRFCDELTRVAKHLSDTAMISVAFRRRAEQLAKMGENERARADINAAMVAARQIGDTTFRTRGITDVTLVSGYIALRSSPKEAEPALRRVVDDYKAANYEKGLGTAYLYLAQSRAALGMIESARAVFDSATDLMQRQRETVRGSAERGAFLDDARATIDQIMAFHAGHNARDAFEYFERTRSRVLLEQLTDSRGQLPAPPESVLVALQRRLSDSDIVLSYAVLPTEILIWTIGSKRFEMHRVSIAASELEELVNRVQRSILDPSAEPDVAASERLHRLLVDSAGQIEGEANLTVVPDRWLHFVPFAALRDGATRRFLVQDHSVTYAPSATLLVTTRGEPHRSLSRSSRVLAFGNPKFDGRVFQLPDLPAAEREADAVADLYGHQKAVVRVDATDVALERMAPSSEILHFAGHAVVGRDAPQLSHLVLASDGRSDGAVFASEIAHWRLPRTRLVILSGCSTGDGRLSATEGASSLARAFFAAGVPAVLSSLWAIDDNATADFFIAFHRRVAQGHPAAVALRETQMEWLGDTKSQARPMSSWAAFQLFGG
jgi:CHAT domain-containing protein